MSVTIIEGKLLPVRRDKQVGTGGSSSGGFGGAIVSESSPAGVMPYTWDGSIFAINGAIQTTSLIVEDLTDGFVPYQRIDSVDDSLANSPIYTDGTNVGIGTGAVVLDSPLHVAGRIRAASVAIQSLSGNADFSIRTLDELGYWDFAAEQTSGRFTIYDAVSDTNPFYIEKGAPDSSFHIKATTGFIGFGFTTPLSALCINGGLHVGGESAAGDNNLLIDGTGKFVGAISEPNYTAGFQGSNWQISTVGDGEFNNLLVRGGLQVYELIINQLHYQNGGLVIGAGAGKVKSVALATVGSEQLYFETPEGTAMSPFSAGAIVMVQRVDINRTTVVKKYVRQVSAIQADMRVDLTTTTGWATASDVGIFEIGDEVVAIGHVSNTALDSSIYFSATDTDNPFMRVFDGVNTYGKWSLADKTTIKLQLGNLESLAGYDIVPASPGYGLYSSNVYLTGKIILPSAGMTDEGSASTDIRIYAGDTYDNRAAANFRVTQAGALTAYGVVELGTAVVDYGGISQSLAIRGTDIWENSYSNDGSGIGINRIGYGGGVTKFRDFTVYDGKGGKLISVAGTSGNIYFGNTVIPNAVSLIMSNGTVDFSAATSLNFGGCSYEVTGTTDITCPADEADMTTMSRTVTPKGSKIYIAFEASFYTSANSQTFWLMINVGDANVRTMNCFIYGGNVPISISHIANVAPGEAITVKIKWYGSTNISQRGSSDGYRAMHILDLY